MQPFLDLANTQTERLNHKQYNQLLVNWYESGTHFIGKHRDSENGLDSRATIFSLSLGATRKFRIRNYATSKIVKDIMLTDGTIIIMGGRMQKDYTHEIVKVTGAKAATIGKRINITCRVFT